MMSEHVADRMGGKGFTQVRGFSPWIWDFAGFFFFSLYLAKEPRWPRREGVRGQFIRLLLVGRGVAVGSRGSRDGCW